MNTIQITLPDKELNFLENYAKQQGITVSKLIENWTQRLQEKHHLHPDLAAITGILPVELDVKEEYCRHVLDKHQ